MSEPAASDRVSFTTLDAQENLITRTGKVFRTFGRNIQYVSIHTDDSKPGQVYVRLVRDVEVIAKALFGG